MKLKRVNSFMFFILFLLGGILEQGDIIQGSFHGIMWFTGLIIIPEIVTDLASKRWEKSHLVQMIIWYSTALLMSILIVSSTSHEIKELKPVIWGILLSFIWMSIRGGYLSRVEEKIDNLLQPNIPAKGSKRSSEMKRK